jgi:hypothetical protein
LARRRDAIEMAAAHRRSSVMIMAGTMIGSGRRSKGIDAERMEP